MTTDRRQFLRTTGLVSAAALLSLPTRAADTGNETVLNLDPTPDNPRNSEGSFVALKSGLILFIYTRFQGGAADHSPAQLVSIESEDRGRTWSREPRTVVENPPGANVMSVSLLRLRSGSIALFYLAKNSLLDCRPVMRISTDEAHTWSEARHVGDAPGYFVLNNDRVIQLQSGRLVAPVTFHRSRGSDPQSYGTLDMRTIALWFGHLNRLRLRRVDLGWLKT
ncbi:MAG: sialidase family protein [Verrucomicrobiota bacterium]